MSFTSIGTGPGHAFGETFLELVPDERIRHVDALDDPNLPCEMQTTISPKRASCGAGPSAVRDGIPA